MAIRRTCVAASAQIRWGVWMWMWLRLVGTSAQIRLGWAPRRRSDGGCGCGYRKRDNTPRYCSFTVTAAGDMLAGACVRV